MIHGEVHKVEHAHQGQAICRGIHRTYHVHPHVHVDGSDTEWSGGRSRETRVRDSVATNVVIFHAHEHIAIGEHELTGFVGMVTHDSNWGMAIWTVRGPGIAFRVSQGDGNEEKRNKM